MTMAMLPINMVEPPLLVRHDHESRDYMEESVSDRGVLEPIIVRRIQGGRYRIIDGYGRFLLAKRRGDSHILAKVIDCTDTEEIILNIELNQSKKVLSIKDIVSGIEMLRNKGIRDDDIKRMLKLPKSTKYRIFWLLEFPEEIREMFLEERLALYVADIIHNAINELGEDRVKEIINNAKTIELSKEELGGIITRVLKMEIQRSKLIQKPEKAIEEEVKPKEKEEKEERKDDVLERVTNTIATYMGAEPISEEEVMKPIEEEESEEEEIKERAKDVLREIGEEIREEREEKDKIYIKLDEAQGFIEKARAILYQLSNSPILADVTKERIKKINNELYLILEDLIYVQSLLK